MAETIDRTQRITEIVQETDFSWLEAAEVEVDPYVYILGLDPGGTTGVAMLRVDTRDDKIKPELVYLHQIEDGRYGFKDWFKDSQVTYNVIIVSEKWKERNIKGANREPQYIEGLMHMLWDDDNIEYQYPQVKELIPDEWLKKNNLWTEGKRHQMDALKHAFAYLRNDGHSATLESLSEPADGGEGEESEPMAQPGEAENAQISDDVKDATEAAAEATEAMAEAAEQAAEAMQAFADEVKKGLEPADDKDQKGTGPGEQWDGWKELKIEDDGTERKRRERNGGFAGFEPLDFDSGSTLFSD